MKPEPPPDESAQLQPDSIDAGTAFCLGDGRTGQLGRFDIGITLNDAGK